MKNMGRKVFISVLGTGYYEACKYVKGSFVSTETRFIQQATLEFLKVKNNWTTTNVVGEVIDRIIILLTDGAKEANWNKNITTRFNRKTEKEEPYTGLEKVFLDMNMSCPIETLSIPDGKTEEEMWDIFNIVYQSLHPNDELYFDLTHSFRYLPMLVLVLGNYAKFLKKVSVKHISYGNYEARNQNTNEAPLMDILPLTMLQDWTFAAADLIQNGNIEKLQELKEANALTPMLRNKGAKNLNRRMVKDPLDSYVNSLQAFLQDMKLCLAPNILSGTTMNVIRDCHEQVKEVYEEVIAPIPPIIEKIELSLQDFETTDTMHPESIRNGYTAAKWCYDHQLYQQAITILEENITTDFCQRLGTDEKVYDQRSASAAFLRHKGYCEDDWKKEYKEEDKQQKWENTKKRVQSALYPDTIEFIEVFSDDADWIHKKRNAYNHASMTNGRMISPNDIERLGDIFRQILSRTR